MKDEPEHYRLSPSSAYRWLRCPGSARDDLPSRGGDAANLGTLAHKILECKLKVETVPQDVEDDFQDLSTYDQDTMMGSVTLFYDFVNSLDCFVWSSELKLKHEVTPDHGGTMDFVGLKKVDDEIHMYVVDLKYGTVVEVGAQDNDQLKCYANLALQFFKAKGYEPTKVFGVIIQPRVNPEPDVSEYSLEDLFLHDYSVFEAYADDRIEAGDHCTYCPLLAGCKAASDYGLELAQSEFENFDQPSQMDIRTAEKINRFKSVYEKLDEVAKQIIINHVKEGGKLKLTQLTNSYSRYGWVNEEHAEKEIERILEKVGETVDAVKDPPKLRTPAQVESVLKELGVKKPKDLIQSLKIRKRSGFKVVDSKIRAEAPIFDDEFEILDSGE